MLAFVLVAVIGSIVYVGGADSLESVYNAIKSNVSIFQSNYHGKVEYNSNCYLEYFINAYSDNRYQNYTRGFNVMVYLMNIDMNQVGNTFGYYAEARACADKIGAHFLGIWKSDNISVEYFHKLPNIVYHEKSRSRESSLAQLHYCAKLFPWERSYAAWPSYIPMVRHDFSLVLSDYIGRTYGNDANISTLRIPLTKFSESNLLLKHHNVSMDKKRDIIDILANHELKEKLFYGKYDLLTNLESLPMIPDATVSIRCNDILHAINEADYGFTNFHIYTHIIPKLSNLTIYITTESTDFHDHGNSQACKDIIVSLILFLHMKYEDARIAVLRTLPFESLIMKTAAKYCICAVSTFCLWPALLNTHAVYFPQTFVVQERSTKALTDVWHWIVKPKIYQFHYHMNRDPDGSKLTKVLHTLMSSLELNNTLILPSKPQINRWRLL
jgi:hypothetical protein